LLVLRRLPWALRHGGGTVHGPDLHSVPRGPAGEPDRRLGPDDSGPYPLMTPAEMRESLELLPSWVLEQKAAANRQVIAVMRQRLAAGEQVARMYQQLGLAWLERQAEAAEQLLTERQAGDQTQRGGGSALNGLPAPAVPQPTGPCGEPLANRQRARCRRVARSARQLGVQQPGRQPDGRPADAQVDVDVAAADIARTVTPRGRSLPSTTGPSPESRSA
jgi:hypothetical protein